MELHKDGWPVLALLTQQLAIIKKRMIINKYDQKKDTEALPELRKASSFMTTYRGCPIINQRSDGSGTLPAHPTEKTANPESLPALWKTSFFINSRDHAMLKIGVGGSDS